MRGLKPPQRRPKNASAFAAQVRVIAPAADLSGYAPLASPAFTGAPTAPTPASGDDSTRLATTAFVTEAVMAVAPSATVLCAFRNDDTSDLTALFNASGTVYIDLVNGLLTKTAPAFYDFTAYSAVEIHTAFNQSGVGAYPPGGLKVSSRFATPIPTKSGGTVDADTWTVTLNPNNSRLMVQFGGSQWKDNATWNNASGAEAGTESVAIFPFRLGLGLLNIPQNSSPTTGLNWVDVQIRGLK